MARFWGCYIYELIGNIVYSTGDEIMSHLEQLKAVIEALRLLSENEWRDDWAPELIDAREKAKKAIAHADSLLKWAESLESEEMVEGMEAKERIAKFEHGILNNNYDPPEGIAAIAAMPPAQVIATGVWVSQDELDAGDRLLEKIEEEQQESSQPKDCWVAFKAQYIPCLGDKIDVDLHKANAWHNFECGWMAAQTSADLLKIAVEALEFYATIENYYEVIKDHVFNTTPIREDRGKKAIEALRNIKTEGK